MRTFGGFDDPVSSAIMPDSAAEILVTGGAGFIGSAGSCKATFYEC